MPISTLQRAKRALVSILLRLASFYGVRPDLDREAADDSVLKAYKRVVLKAHPDKGGHTTKFQSLQAAKETWDNARQQGRPAGNPRFSVGKIVPSGASSSDALGGFRIQSTAVLLTYAGR